MWTRLIVVALLFTCWEVSSACEWTDREQCKSDVGQLITYRTEAIEYAFGNVFGPLPRQIEVRFVNSDDGQFAKFSGRVAYDAAQRMLVVPQRLISSRLPTPMHWAAAYWPYYQDRRYQDLFPVIAEIDNALWGAVLQENARATGMSWPHAECASIDLTKRLPCQMLVAGIAALLTEREAPMFNANPLDRIWPEQFSDFQQRSWRSERDYADVQHYGGIQLLRPLFSEFGVPNALTYVAQTPFRVENDNMRASALRYQERAREVLQSRPVPVIVTGQSDDDPGKAGDPGKAITATGKSEPRFVAFGARDGA
jgi:hypothetical protein